MGTVHNNSASPPNRMFFSTSTCDRCHGGFMHLDKETLVSDDVVGCSCVDENVVHRAGVVHSAGLQHISHQRST